MFEKYSPEIILVLISVAGILAITTIILFFLVLKMKRRWADLLRSPSSESLDELLHRHLRENRELQTNLGTLEERMNVVERKMTGAMRYVGLVRYDAFEDVSASQSWSLAMYDEKGDGAILTCLYGRSDCRVYSKQLEGGRTDRSLTREEEDAIHIAARGGRTVAKA